MMGYTNVLSIHFTQGCMQSCPDSANSLGNYYITDTSSTAWPAQVKPFDHGSEVHFHDVAGWHVQNISKKWTMPINNWGSVINQVSIKFEGRVQL